MKRIFILLIVAATTLMNNACGKKDDSNSVRQLNATEQKLVGKWKEAKIIQLDAQGKEITSEVKKCYSFEFFADGKGNWLLDKDAICQDGNNWTKRTIEWKVENNTLILFNLDGGENYLKFNGIGGLEIASINENVFEFYMPVSENIKGFYDPKMDKLMYHYERVK